MGARVRSSFDPARYWEHRYASGGDSGAGSVGRLADFKASIVNQLVRGFGIHRVLELGCGNGAQIALGAYPEYVGLDVSDTALVQCRQRFEGDESKQFLTSPPDSANLCLSMDVIDHLVRDEDYDAHLEMLFGRASDLVVIYATNRKATLTAAHVRFRVFTIDIRDRFDGWELRAILENPYRPESLCNFFVYTPVS